MAAKRAVIRTVNRRPSKSRFLPLFFFFFFTHKTFTSSLPLLLFNSPLCHIKNTFCFCFFLFI